MWKIYLFEFVVVLIVSILWVHILNQNNNNEDNI